MTEGPGASILSAREQERYQQQIEELRSQLHELYRQASEAGPGALQRENPFYRQVESLITKIKAMPMEIGGVALNGFGELPLRPIPEKSIGATGFEPAT